MPPAESIVFYAACLAMAALLWQARRAPGLGGWQSALRLVVPVAMVWLILGIATVDGRGSRLAAALKGLQVNAKLIPVQSDPVTVLKVGDRSDDADLVVRPYQEQRLNQATQLKEARVNLVVAAHRDPAQSEQIRTRLDFRNYAPNDVLDVPGMVVTAGDDSQEPPANVGYNTWSVDLPPGRETTIHIYRDNGRTAQSQRFVLRREFRIANRVATAQRPARIEVTFTTPNIVPAGSCAEPRGRLMPAISEDAATMSYLDPQDLVFPDLGDGGHPRAVLGGNAVGSVFDQNQPCASLRQQFGWPANGDRAGAVQLIVTHHVTPWLLPVLLTMSALGYWIFGRTALIANRAERIVVPMLYFLLANRVLVAIAAALIDQKREASEFSLDAALAIIVLPPLFAVLLRPARLASQTSWLALLTMTVGFFVALTIWLRQFLPPDSDELNMPFLVVLIFALIPLIARALWGDIATTGGALLPRLSRGWIRVERWFRRIGIRLQRLIRRFGRALASGRPGLQRQGGPRSWLSFVVALLERPFRPLRKSNLLLRGCLILLLAGSVRILLLLVFGAKERLLFVPLSVPYLAAIIAGFAITVQGLRELDEARGWGVATATMAILFAVPVTMFAISDSGFAIVHLIPLCALGAMFCVTEWHSSRAANAWTVSAFILPLAVLVISLGLLTYDALHKVENANTPIAERMSRALDLSSGSGNDVRLIQWRAPDKVEAIGTRAAFEQMEQTMQLHALNGSLVGEGYLYPERLPSMLKEQAWDYGASVHLMRPFGRIGAVVFLLVLAYFAFAVCSQHDAAGRPLPPRGPVLTVIGFMAAGTLAVVGLYMVLANLLIVPFTGRNLYLLASRSLADMFEGGMLLLLSALAVPREPEPA